MASSMNELMECPICLDVMQGRIRQCKMGHSFCEPCVLKLEAQKCPNCRKSMGNSRNYMLEQLIAGLLISNNEIRNNVSTCEAKKFLGSVCEWSGKPSEALQHFKEAHKDNCRLEFKGEMFLKFELQRNHKTLQAIDLHNGQELVYFKSKVDIEKKLVYFVFQILGLSPEAKNYFYEFEIEGKSVQKLKVTLMCQPNSQDPEDLFEDGKTVAFTFGTVKNFLNEKSELSIRYRIMNCKSALKSLPHIPLPMNPFYESVLFPSKNTQSRKPLHYKKK